MGQRAMRGIELARPPSETYQKLGMSRTAEDQKTKRETGATRGSQGREQWHCSESSKEKCINYQGTKAQKYLTPLLQNQTHLFLAHLTFAPSSSSLYRTTYHHLLHTKNSSDSSLEKLTKDILNLHAQKHPTGLKNGIESKSLNSDSKRAHDDPSDGFAEKVEEVVEEHLFRAVGWLVLSCGRLQVAVWISW